MIGVLILAGGLGQRMGGIDKGWSLQNQESFIEIVLRQIQQQASVLENQSATIVISANRNIKDYLRLGCPVITDVRSGFCGPLAGIEAAMCAPALCHVSRWITWPVDSLKVPEDYLLKMSVPTQKVCVLKQHQRSHYAHLSIPNHFKGTLSSYLDAQQYSIKGWLRSLSKDCDIVSEIKLSEHDLILNCNQTLCGTTRFNHESNVLR